MMSDIDVKRLRISLGLTQNEFCERFGINIYTLRDWEYGRYVPSPLARVLLTVISHNPDAVGNALKRLTAA